MEELVYEMNDALSEAIDELEKDLEFNPKKFLGIELYPERLWSALTFVATISFGLLQQKISKET